MGRAVDLARLLNSSGNVPDARLVALAASKLSGQVPDANAPSGSVIQVVHATKTDTQSFAPSTTFSDIAGLSVTLTPLSNASKFLVMWSVSAGNGSDLSHFYVRLQRNGTNITLADASGSKVSNSGMVINTSVAGQRLTNSSSFLDSPATSSAVTYKLQGTSNITGGTSWVNRSIRDNDAVGYDGRDTSSITVLEIAG